MTNTHITFGQAIDNGLEDKNDRADACTCIVSAMNSHNFSTDCGLFAIAAGVAGKEGGNPKKVAGIAIQQAAMAYSSIYGSILTDEDTLKVSDALLEMTKKANKAIYTHTSKEKQTDIASLTTMIIYKGLGYFAHVGNTRAYLVSGKTIKQITKDQSKEGAKTLTSPLGQAADPEIDNSSHPLPMDAKILLCSESLWRFVNEENILKFLSEEPYPQSACEKLVAFSKTNGSTEQVTAVAIYMPEA
jgi:serine/threonine protein phosphatase PrpC